MDKNLDALASAAKTKLEVQKKQGSKAVEAPVEDIYAEFRDDNDNMKTTIPVAPVDDIIEEEYQAIDEEDLQIYEDGPYMSQVAIWKKQYNSVIHTQIVEKHFVFRTLNRFEYKKIIAMENVDALMREELICSHCVLHPKMDFKTMAVADSGYPSTLAQIILENSGFTKEYGIEIL